MKLDLNRYNYTERQLLFGVNGDPGLNDEVEELKKRADKTDILLKKIIKDIGTIINKLPKDIAHQVVKDVKGKDKIEK